MTDVSDTTLDTDLENQPMTDWENEPTLTDLKQDFTSSSQGHGDHVRKVQVWLDNLNVTGSAKPKQKEGRSQIVPRLIRKQAEWRYAALSEPFLSNESMFKVMPITWEDVKGAEQNELILNHQFNTKLDKTSFIDEYVRTAVDEGTVILKTFWSFEEETYEDTVPVYRYFDRPELMEQYQQLLQLKQENPTMFHIRVPEEIKEGLRVSIEQGRPIQAVVENYEPKTLTRTVRNHPGVEICDFENVIIDPLAKGDMDKARFVIHSWETSKDELQRDSKYTNLDKLGKSSGSVLNTADHTVTADDPNFNFADEPRAKFVIHEYWGFWDIDNSGVTKPIVAAWVDNVMVRLEENPYPHKKLPFVLVQYLPVRKSNYGEPDGHLLEDNQKIAGAVTRGMIDIMARSANGQMGIRKDALDAVNKLKFQRGQNYEYNQTVDPRVGMYMHTYAEIPQSAQFMLQSQNIEAESLTGVQSFAGGLSGESYGQVAAGIRGVLDAAGRREMGILRRLIAGIVTVGKHWTAMNAEFLDEEEVIRITNEEFIPVDREDLSGSYDFSLDISTAEEDAARAERLEFMLQTTGNTLPQDMVFQIMSKVAKLRKMPDLAKQLQEYQPQPDPIDEERRILENERIRADIAYQIGRANESESDAVLSQSKAREALSKARNLDSNSDKIDLDFIEQESGVTQARELEKQGAQARAQLGTKIAEHQMRKQENSDNFSRDLFAQAVAKGKAKAK